MFDTNFVRIMSIFFPGILAILFIQLFNEKNKKYNNSEVVYYSFFIGFISHLIFSIFVEKSIIESILNNETSGVLRIRDLLFSSVIGFIIAIVFVFFRNNGKIHNFLIKKGISYTTGYSNAISTIYKSDNEICSALRKKFVCIKLLDGSSNYFGKLFLYEVHENFIEIALVGSPNIYFKNNQEPNSKEYEQHAVYLTLTPGSFFIEFYEEE